MILTTDVQDSIIELLKTYRCLRFDQIEALMAMKYGSRRTYACKEAAHLANICSHLVCQPADGYLAMSGAAPNAELLAAIDVMLEFRQDGVEFYCPGKPPYKLVFHKNNPKGGIRAYYVVVVARGAEYRMAQEMLGAYKNERNAVIFILEDLRQAENIHFPYEHYHAVSKNGRYAFYKGAVCDS
jgi:hypothetical protein